MNSRHILTALATASLVAGGSALAQGRGGGHGGGHGQGHGVGVGVGVGVGHDRIRVDSDIRRNDVGVNTRDDARLNSRGPDNANVRARARANDNSVLARGRVSTDLTLLRTGLVVRNSAGTNLGTIRRINRTRDGRIVNVLVRDPLGRSRTIPVAPNSLRISGGLVTVID